MLMKPLINLVWEGAATALSEVLKNGLGHYATKQSLYKTLLFPLD